MADNRFHELLGLPEDLSNPDFYQLLGVDRGQTDTSVIEGRFKEQMTRVQHIDNPRHKEFIEFLKGELKRARAVLTDDSRRADYDLEIAEERADGLRKILSHMLVEGTLSQVAEISVIREGQNLGLDVMYIKQVVDEELQKAGARRGNGNGHASQMDVSRKAQEVARQIQDARMDARLAQTRAHIAELDKKKAEEQVVAVAEKARLAELQKRKAEAAVHEVKEKARQAESKRNRAEIQVQRIQEQAKHAQELARKAITREQVAAAKIQTSEKEKRRLDERLQQTQTRLNALANATEKELDTVRVQGLRWPRLALCYACLLGATLAGDGLRKAAPALADRLAGALTSLFDKVPVIPGAAVPLLGLALLVPLLHLLSGRRSPVFIGPLVLAVALALAAGLMR